LPRLAGDRVAQYAMPWISISQTSPWRIHIGGLRASQVAGQGRLGTARSGPRFFVLKSAAAQDAAHDRGADRHHAQFQSKQVWARCDAAEWALIAIISIRLSTVPMRP
jgi:hypothetical protein